MNRWSSVNLGTGSVHSDAGARSIRMVNGLALLAIVASWVALVFIIVAPVPKALPMNVLTQLLMGLVLWLNYRGRYGLAASIFIVFAELAVIAQAWVVGLESGVYLWLIPIITVPYLIFGIHQRTWAIAHSLLSVSMLSGIVLWQAQADTLMWDPAYALLSVAWTVFAMGYHGLKVNEELADGKREVLDREGEHLAQSERQGEEIQRITTRRIETEQKLMEHLFRVSGLNEFSEKLSEAKTESGVLELAADQAKRITGSQLIEVALLDASESSFNCFVLDAKDGLGATGWKSREGQTLIDQVVDEKAILLSNECREDTDERWQNLAQEGMRSAMVLPMQAGTTVVGVLTAGARWVGHFDRLTYLLVQQFTAVLGTHIGLRRALGHLESSLNLSDALLVNILPKSVASRMKQGEKQIADRIDNAAVLFCDLAGFTSYSSDAPPEEVVTLLQQFFGVMEGECAVHTVEKIKTIGDSFMAAAGVTVAVEDPAHAMASFAFDVARQLRALLAGSYTTVGFRMGFHIGPVVAGVIGADRLFFDVWGDTVNMASRMESNGVLGEVTCSNEVREALADRWNFECLGPVAIKGKGEQVVWLLKGPKEGGDPTAQSMDRLSSTSSEESTSA